MHLGASFAHPVEGMRLLGLVGLIGLIGLFGHPKHFLQLRYSACGLEDCAEMHVRRETLLGGSWDSAGMVLSTSIRVITTIVT